MGDMENVLQPSVTRPVLASVLNAMSITPSIGSSVGDTPWEVKPTFGRSWESSSLQTVRDGFVFNGNPLTITDNWHTDFEKTRSIIGAENTAAIKAYSPNGFATVTLSLGIPEVGMLHEAETDIILYLVRDYGSPSGYAISEIVHEQKKGLVDEAGTSATVQKAKCSDTDAEELCHSFEMSFAVMAPLLHDVIAISATDEKSRRTTTYLNHGIEFDGASLIEPERAEIFIKETSQDPGRFLDLTQHDRRHNVWTDQHGGLWEINPFGTYVSIDPTVVPADVDPDSVVMTRTHSGFAPMVELEQQRAASHWDGTAIQGTLRPAFSYSYGE